MPFPDPQSIGTSSTENELSTLQKRTSAFQGTEMAFDTALLVIKHLGGNIPGREAPKNWRTKAQKQAGKRKELRDCFVEPWYVSVIFPRGSGV